MVDPMARRVNKELAESALGWVVAKHVLLPFVPCALEIVVLFVAVVIEEVDVGGQFMDGEDFGGEQVGDVDLVEEEVLGADVEDGAFHALDRCFRVLS